MSKRFLYTISIILVIILATGIAIFFAKGYRLSPSTGTVAGTGIISVTSKPDQASIYLDGHLMNATPANINSLPPKTYEVKISKEGFISWQKQVEVRQGLVTDIKATLFPAIPSLYPLTFSGVENVKLSPDEQRIVYVVPGSDKRSGVWVWDMSEKPIGFSRGREPHQVVPPSTTLNYAKATLRWSPDSTQLMAIFPEHALLIDASKYNDPPRDITLTYQPTLNTWLNDEKLNINSQIQTITDLNIRQIASSAASLSATPSANIKWAPDETKFLVKSSSTTPGYKIYDLENNTSFDLPEAISYTWLPAKSDLTEHLIAIKKDPDNPEMLRVSVIEFDGSNEAIIYAGKFDPAHVFTWPDGSRVVIVTALSIPTASQPNLFGINLK